MMRIRNVLCWLFGEASCFGSSRHFVQVSCLLFVAGFALLVHSTRMGVPARMPSPHRGAMGLIVVSGLRVPHLRHEDIRRSTSACGKRAGRRQGRSRAFANSIVRSSRYMSSEERGAPIATAFISDRKAASGRQSLAGVALTRLVTTCRGATPRPTPSATEPTWSPALADRRPWTAARTTSPRRQRSSMDLPSSTCTLSQTAPNSGTFSQFDRRRTRQGYHET